MIRSGHSRLVRLFNSCYRYNDLIVLNNKELLDYLKEIYPSQLTVEKADRSDHQKNYLDLAFIIDSESKLSMPKKIFSESLKLVKNCGYMLSSNV